MTGVQTCALPISANHYLDAEVYAAAAADILNVRSLGLEAPHRSLPDLAAYDDRHNTRYPHPEVPIYDDPL